MSRRWTYALSLAGALYSGFIVVWFFAFFARGVREPVTQYAGAIFFSLVLVMSPFVVTAFTQYFEPSTRSPRFTVIATAFLLVCSGILYSPGLQPYQDGEFMAVFFLAIPQLIFAVACLIYALHLRRKGI